jgi:hypothetical protein
MIRKFALQKKSSVKLKNELRFTKFPVAKNKQVLTVVRLTLGDYNPYRMIRFHYCPVATNIIDVKQNEYKTVIYFSFRKSPKKPS